MKVKLLGLALILLAVSLLPKIFTSKQNNINPESLTGEYNFGETDGEFNGKVFYPTELAVVSEREKVLGVSDRPKRIEVDLANQRLYAFEGDQKIYDFLISSGKWGRTPTGNFRIWIKLRYTKMSGGSKALNTYYYLPNVPYVMFFANDQIPQYRGFGIHGTYWHNNFGTPMSHGCINMKTEEAGLLYNWAGPNLGDNQSGRPTVDNPGTEVIIYGTAPRG